MPKHLLSSLLILIILTIGCGSANPTANRQDVQERMDAAGVATTCALEASYYTQEANQMLLACLNSIHQQNREIIALLERIATNQETRRPLNQ